MDNKFHPSQIELLRFLSELINDKIQDLEEQCNKSNVGKPCESLCSYDAEGYMNFLIDVRDHGYLEFYVGQSFVRALQRRSDLI